MRLLSASPADQSRSAPWETASAAHRSLVPVSRPATDDRLTVA
ncbi:hypothetical protein ABZ137_23945 [Streptomyces bobili]